MPVVGAIAGGLAGGLGAGAIFGVPAGFAVSGGLIAAGALIGAGVGAFGGSFVEGMMKTPGMPGMPEPVAGRIQEVDYETEGWANIMRKAQGRKGTMLTGQLTQTEATVKRATLLGG